MAERYAGMLSDQQIRDFLPVLEILMPVPLKFAAFRCRFTPLMA